MLYLHIQTEESISCLGQRFHQFLIWTEWDKIPFNVFVMESENTSNAWKHRSNLQKIQQLWDTETHQRIEKPPTTLWLQKWTFYIQFTFHNQLFTYGFAISLIWFPLSFFHFFASLLLAGTNSFIILFK